MADEKFTLGDVVSLRSGGPPDDHRQQAAFCNRKADLSPSPV
jgi:hypothetical protein